MIGIIGSTGSIGTQTLDVARNLGLRVTFLSGNKNVKLLENQAREFKPDIVVVTDEPSAKSLKASLSDTAVKVVYGMDELINSCQSFEGSLLVNALVGNVGLRPTIAAIKAKKNIALANKETLVTAGSLIMSLVKENNVSLMPIDSEHSAIFQCIGNSRHQLKKIHLTASGGPFLGRTLDEMKNVTARQALAHPRWNMGPKISIDSATLMNKGLEVIEACHLFDVTLDEINVVIHPQSIIHSMVEFVDGSILAQLGVADMRIPIQYALTYPNRCESPASSLNLLNLQLTFQAPDYENFPCLSLAYKAFQVGGVAPTVLNAANETAVSLFLKERILFNDIPALITDALDSYTVKTCTLENIFSAEAWAKEHVLRTSGLYPTEG